MLPQVLKRFVRKAAFPVPALTAALAKHGFSYGGFSASSDRLHGNEEHRFSRGGFSFVFGFAYSMYGEDVIAVRVASSGKGERSAYLSYFIDYASQRNSLRESGLTHDQALAECLSPHIEYVVRLAGVALSHGRLIPLEQDKVEALGGRVEL